MKTRIPLAFIVAAGVVLAGGAGLWAAAKGPKISVGDDPSLKEGSPQLVLIEVSDFQ